MSATVEHELLDVTRKLLKSIDTQDWDLYADLCDKSLSAYEPEALGNLIEGLAFHRFYFENPRTKLSQQSTISSPYVRVLGDTAVVCYVRMTQRLLADGTIRNQASEETRIWQRIDGNWQHVHFHRSEVSTPNVVDGYRTPGI